MTRMNSNRLNEAMAILQTMNMEDCAMEIQDLINELERVKKIAANRLEELTRYREREELDANDARTVIGEGGLWGAHCRGEI